MALSCRPLRSVFYYILLIFAVSLISSRVWANAPDSAYLFSYSTQLNRGHNGLHFAWSTNQTEWFVIGKEQGFLKSDYGRGGIQKRMLNPSLSRSGNGIWHCIWQLGERDSAFALTSSPDLINWSPQNYIVPNKENRVIEPVIIYKSSKKKFEITFASGPHQYWQISTSDFKSFSLPLAVRAKTSNPSAEVSLPSGKWRGEIHRVAWDVIQKLIDKAESMQFENLKNAESTAQDADKYRGLKGLSINVKVQPDRTKSISNLLTGVFFEDINYSADGGLYGELIQNRDFEYTPADKKFSDPKWAASHSWGVDGNAILSIDSAGPLHANNPHYGMLNIKVKGASLSNTGFDGISVTRGERYRLSFFAKLPELSSAQAEVTLRSGNGQVLGKTLIKITSAGWNRYQSSILASATADSAKLFITPLATGKIGLDMISLFPEKTFRGRTNGLRADLSQIIADIRPKFVRFPGGCVAHGDGLGNIYRWKNTIGPLEARKPQRNIWGYHQSAGLGYFEYFQFCEDIGALPLPVLAAGVPCQNSIDGQQGGIPIKEMDEYVQDVLDLIEYANGPVTSKWGKFRAEAGHPKPFGLKYLGIGNEDLIGNVFEERFKMIFDAVKSKHPEITVVGTVGPFSEGADYTAGWQLAKELGVPMVDEHYYQAPGWFINNQNYYDAYDRSNAKVYLGEYASRGNTWYNALAESIYMATLERNGDVVSMSSYAPLLAKQGRTQWKPDLIYFSNREVHTTPNYEIQKLYGNNAGDQYIPSTLTFSNDNNDVRKRFGISIVRDSNSKDLIIKCINILPVEPQIQLPLQELLKGKVKVEKTILYGDPNDSSNKMTVSLSDADNMLQDVLKPYSVTVYRFKVK